MKLKTCDCCGGELPQVITNIVNEHLQPLGCLTLPGSQPADADGGHAMTLDLDELERLAIEQAAAGCVSGRLKEWPYLMSAFNKLGFYDLGIDGHVNGPPRQVAKMAATLWDLDKETIQLRALRARLEVENERLRKDLKFYEQLAEHYGEALSEKDEPSSG